MYLNSTLSFVTGLGWFDAHKDVGPFDEFTPRAQYQKYSLVMSYYKKISLKRHIFIIQSLLSGQYSRDPLFSSEQITIGGPYSVRGFRGKSILGDEGLYLTSTVSYSLPNIKFWGLGKILKKTQIFTGTDYGHVRQKGGQSASFGEVQVA